MILFHHGLSRDFDGPGERLVLYFKGCNFHCDWCASPESISPEPELLYYQERNPDKTGCCCSQHAYDENTVLNRDLCKHCPDHSCIRIWHNPAFELAGKEVTIDDILKLAENYSGVIDGITFGGGEPTLQGDALLECADLLRKKGFHTAMESNASTVFYQKMINRVSLLYSDLKTLNPVIAKNRMKADISLVRENLCSAAEQQEDFILRIPVIRGVNDQPGEQQELITFCGELKKIRKDRGLHVELLRQHHLGEPKYHALGREYLLQGTPAAEKSSVIALAEGLQKCGIQTSHFV